MNSGLFVTVSTCLCGKNQAARALQRQPKHSIIYVSLSAVEELMHPRLGTDADTNIHTITQRKAGENKPSENGFSHIALQSIKWDARMVLEKNTGLY